MYLDILSLLVGFLCLFVVVVMLFTGRRNYKANGYLIAILAIVGAQRFLHGAEALNFTDITYSPIKIKPVFAFCIIPVYYLFFSRLILNKGNFKKELLHFIVPTLLALATFVIADYKINRFVFLGYCTLYFGNILFIVVKFIYKTNLSMIDKISYSAKKTWLLLMLILTFLLIVYSNYFLFYGLYSQINLSTFYRYSSLMWFAIILYMFKNPIIIFGDLSLLKNIKLNETHSFKIWNHKLLKTLEEKDRKVANTLFNKVDSIISEIQTLQKSVAMISNTTLNAESLAKELKTPKRHLDFIFKYYCHYSISDFSNLIKVNYALKLINEGYLEKYTVDSLGKDCLFNSRFTFSKNFKKFVGVSVSNFSITENTHHEAERASED